jgi:hypothetical protein
MGIRVRKHSSSSWSLSTSELAKAHLEFLCTHHDLSEPLARRFTEKMSKHRLRKWHKRYLRKQQWGPEIPADTTPEQGALEDAVSSASTSTTESPYFFCTAMVAASSSSAAAASSSSAAAASSSSSASAASSSSRECVTDPVIPDEPDKPSTGTKVRFVDGTKEEDAAINLGTPQYKCGLRKRPPTSEICFVSGFGDVKKCEDDDGPYSDETPQPTEVPDGCVDFVPYYLPLPPVSAAHSCALTLHEQVCTFLLPSLPSPPNPIPCEAGVSPPVSAAITTSSSSGSSGNRSGNGSNAADDGDVAEGEWW